MTYEELELRVVVVVYTTAIVPIIILFNLHLKYQLPRSILNIYLSSFLICALGWELNQFIPKNINWVMNSLADAGTISLGGILLTGKLMGSDRRVFNQWNIGAFLILLIWCISQNIFVEMFLYYDQLAVGKDLSWAPLAPTGPWLNPVLFQYGDRTITLHGQVPWLLMTPILYKVTMQFQNEEIK